MVAFYDLSAKKPNGEQVAFEDLKGKVVLVVNTGVQCIFTPQLADLQQLHEKYHEKGLVILGFPSGQFPKEAAADDAAIGAFCQKNYGVTFDVLAKSDVNGQNTNEVFRFLKKEKPGLFGLQNIKWNFTKFLVNKDGKVVERFAPNVKPSKISGQIEKLLAS
ncbi:thioredoxin-like protein [Acaromyces ingoldii]|uniref:Glutathione peroxidase n=1 Tax=Acaromyces ingoldii TaxID=215250 RepID=A0A316YIU3_9BASI|nr:thioredoxin-like protein [Acaromyces ingoldii]PWN88013.1 thioredoxin-like protein [Acaromyces ingoldii]